MCDKSVDERVTRIVAGITDQLGPAMESKITACVNNSMHDAVNTIALEFTGENYDNRGKVKDAIQFLITFKKWFILPIMAVASIPAKAIYDMINGPNP